MLLIPVMTYGWLITSLVIWWMIPSLSWLAEIRWPVLHGSWMSLIQLSYPMFSVNGRMKVCGNIQNSPSKPTSCAACKGRG